MSTKMKRCVVVLTVFLPVLAMATSRRAESTVNVTATVIRSSHTLDGGLHSSAVESQVHTPDGGTYQQIDF